MTKAKNMKNPSVKNVMSLNPYGGVHNPFAVLGEFVPGAGLKMEQLGLIPVWHSEYRKMMEIIDTHRFYRCLLEDILGTRFQDLLRRSAHAISPVSLHNRNLLDGTPPPPAKAQHNPHARTRRPTKRPSRGNGLPSGKSRQGVRGS